MFFLSFVILNYNSNFWIGNILLQSYFKRKDLSFNYGKKPKTTCFLPAVRAGTFTFVLLCRMSSFSPTKSDSKWEKIYFSDFKWKNSNFQILSEKWKCDILIFVNSNCLDFTTKTFVPKANKQLSELCLWLLGDRLLARNCMFFNKQLFELCLWTVSQYSNIAI